MTAMQPIEAASAAVRIATGTLGHVMDVLLPARCPACGTLVDGHGAVCAACWSQLNFTEAPFCAACGVPFELDLGPDTLCAECLVQQPGFAPLRAVLAYDDGSQPMILRFKFADATHCAPTFAGWMARAGAGLLDGADWLIPVPLHPWRLFSRRYNQAALLAAGLSRLSGVPSAPLALRRIKRTERQSRLSRSQRARNVAGAFAVAPGWADRLRGRKVVLIDDVFTTGATLNACAAALKKTGDIDISSVVLARRTAG